MADKTFFIGTQIEKRNPSAPKDNVIISGFMLVDKMHKIPFAGFS